MSASSEELNSTTQVEEYFRAYSRSVRSLCRRLLQDSDASEEVAQETFERALVSLKGDPRVNAHPHAWLLTIARNLCIDRIRRRRLAPLIASVPLDSVDDRLDRGEARRLADQTMEHVLARERSHSIRPSLRAALAELGATERRIFLDHEEGGIGFDALARREGSTADTVRNIAFRARRQLRQALSRDLLAPVLVGWARVRGFVQRWMNRMTISRDADFTFQTAIAGFIITISNLLVPSMGNSPAREADFGILARRQTVAVNSRSIPVNDPSFVAPKSSPPTGNAGPVSIDVGHGPTNDHAATPTDSTVHAGVRSPDGTKIYDTQTDVECFDHPSSTLPPESPFWTSC